ncbi:MAG: hypothetical protein OEW00_01150 [candidate division Zixibacteria bacterium]|nr:hypothetical protein [candidate division Zixibacteria bacterium]
MSNPRKMPKLTGLLPILVVGLAILPAVPAAGRTNGYGIVIRVDAAPLAWSESKLETKLQKYLTRMPNIRALPHGRQAGPMPAFPEDTFNLDSLVDWGLETGQDYLMLVMVGSERLERRKTFNVPLVFHRYETVGVIEGELRFVDLRKGKLLIAEPFEVNQKGKRIFQAAMDDDVNDPSIHLTASQKIRFFDSLEDKLARRLADKITRYTRGR